MNRKYCVVYFIISILALSEVLFAQIEIFDSTFSSDGIVISDFGSTFERCEGLALMSNEKIVVAGYSVTPTGNANIVIERYNVDGTYDHSFGDEGIVITDLNNKTDFATKIVIQKDDKIVVTGSSDSKLIALRYNIDGSLDETFNSDGVFEFGIGQSEVGNSVKIQNDQKILITGTIRVGVEGLDIVLIRLDSLGFLDSTFNNNGFVVIDILEGFDKGHDLIVNDDNKILVTGFLNRTIGLIQFNSNGTKDSSFNENGISLVYNPNGEGNFGGYGMTMQVDGKILIVGEATGGGFGNDSKILVVRFNKNGTLDNSFSEDGITTIDLNESDRGTCIAVQSDNKIVIAGSAGNDFAILRLNANGSLDNTFWGDGKKSIGFSDEDYGRSLVLQNDGKIVVSGFSINGNDWDFSTIRLNNPNYITNINSTREMNNDFFLFQNYPNPFNPSTKINYILPQSGLTQIYLFDILGREIMKLVNEFKEVGNYEVEFNARELPNGVYFYKIISGRYSRTRKMVLLK